MLPILFVTLTNSVSQSSLLSGVSEMVHCEASQSLSDQQEELFMPHCFNCIFAETLLNLRLLCQFQGIRFNLTK